MSGPRRRVRYSIAMSLDGFIAGPKGEFDWIIMDPDIDFAALAADFDTLLMGRKTYEIADSSDGEVAGFEGMKSYVFSSTLSPEDHPGVTIVGSGIEETVRDLRSAPGRDLWLFGGGEIFRCLHAAGLVDTFEVAIIPVLLGEGIRAAPPPMELTSLTLTSHEVMPKSGIVILHYDVRRAEA